MARLGKPGHRQAYPSSRVLGAIVRGRQRGHIREKFRAAKRLIIPGPGPVPKGCNGQVFAARSARVRYRIVASPHVKKAALGHYRVRLNGEWIVVPDNAVVTEPNKFGPAVVWPYMGTAYAPAPGRKQRICVCPSCRVVKIVQRSRIGLSQFPRCQKRPSCGGTVP